MYDENIPGVLVIRIFVTQHNDPHRGTPKRLAVIPCKFGDCRRVLESWRANNTWAPSGYNSPVEARFELGSVSLD